MIYEFAISPELFSRPDEIRFINQSFGMEEGRLISEIPKKKWAEKILQIIRTSDNRPVMRESMLSATKKIFKKAIYKRNNQPDIGFSNWTDYVMTAHKERAFRAIIVDQKESNFIEKNLEKYPILKSDIDISDNALWRVPKEMTIKRDAESMAKAIKPMIDCSQEIILLDRNFMPEKQRFRNVLFEIIKIIQNRPYSPSIRKITYHIGDQYKETVEKNCQIYIVKALPKEIKLEIVIWSKNELHDRFVLSDIGGVSFGHGLDEYDGSGPKDVMLSILSQETYMDLWKKCKSKPPAFTIENNNN